MDNSKTLRQLAGILPPTFVNPDETALILIDIQNDYFSPDKLLIPDGKIALKNACRLRDWAAKRSVKIVHIQQVNFNPNSSMFAAKTDGVEIHADIAPRENETVIQKTMPSSFDKTELHEFLRSHGIKQLILAGMMTHMCVETTARCAVPLGYNVIVASDACASRDLPSYDGKTIVSHKAVHENALTAIADRFADIIETDKIINL